MLNQTRLTSFFDWNASRAIALCFCAATAAAPLGAQSTLDPQHMKPLGVTDPRFVSYNVEAVEVTGGRFWAPVKALPQDRPTAPSEAPPQSGFGGNRDSNDPRFQYRSPINLSNAKLRRLAAALGPAFVRVSGSWRNNTYFQDDDQPALKTPPDGFENVMTRAEWKGVVDFSKAVDAEIVASVSISPGTRDASGGAWTSGQATRWLDYNKTVGGKIVAMEFMNEPTLMGLAKMPPGYGAKEYARDSVTFGKFLKQELPGALYLGPSSAAEGVTQTPPLRAGMLTSTESLLKATGPIFDGFSYHVYYTRSHRCSGAAGTDVNTVLSEDWLDRGREANTFYTELRDRLMPGKSIWLTETGEASCGGDTWASTFVDSFRLLDQFGMLAQQGVKSIMYNTLASSDYGWLDENTYDPRPNYWAALLWKRTMGTQSLDPQVARTQSLRVYAQCMKGSTGGVSLLLLNVDKKEGQTVTIPAAGKRYTLSATDVLSKDVLLNGRPIKLLADGTPSNFVGLEQRKGLVTLPPTSITFITLPNAANGACVQ